MWQTPCANFVRAGITILRMVKGASLAPKGLGIVIVEAQATVIATNALLANIR